ncbi:MAG: hypothetical protein SFU85_08890 [Candidatus Methylacidiphilales bacterium]|nr:hypothetical protein [Candidatus Methylacidiphilales bacterium]
MKLGLMIACYAAGMAGANLLLRYTSMAHGWAWWAWFAAANATGFICVVVMPHALKLGSSNVVYALALGGGFCLLQLSAWWLFREPLSAWQWAGVGFVALGLVFLQIKA